MSSMIGMDSGEIRAFAARLRGQADAIMAVMGSVDGVIHQMSQSWQGQDAAEFVDWWQRQHRPALIKTQAAVAGLAQSADNNASQQDTASGVGGGPSRGFTGVHSNSGTSGFNPTSLMFQSLAFTPLGLGFGGAFMIHNAEVGLNQFDPGLGDVAGDAVGLIPGYGTLVSFGSDGAGLVQDFVTGKSITPDLQNLGWDVLTIDPYVGVFKLGMDVNKAISNIPVAQQHLNSWEDSVVARGAAQGGNIATRYDGVGGFVNYVGDATGLSSIF